MVRRMVDGLAEQIPTDLLALIFHAELAAALEKFILKGVELSGLTTVGLSGGVFMNELLTRLLGMRLEQHGLRVLTHQEVPPNDGGISLGQAAVAAFKS